MRGNPYSMKNEDNLKPNSLFNIIDLFPCSRTKIIRILILNEELNISRIIKMTKLNHKSVLNHLEILVAMNLVQEKSFGRIKIYRYKDEVRKNLIIKEMVLFLENNS